MTHLLHHPARLEFVAVSEAAYEAALALAVDAGEAVGLTLWPAQRLAVLRLLLVISSLFCAGAPMPCPALLGLAVEEEVAQDAAGAPEEAVGPPLDAALVLVEDEDGARGDHLALSVDEASGDARNHTTAGRLEDEQRVTCRLDEDRPWGVGPVVGAAARGGGVLGVVRHGGGAVVCMGDTVRASREATRSVRR